MGQFQKILIKIIITIVVDNLTIYREMYSLFPKFRYKKIDWIRDPFIIMNPSVFELSLNEEVELIWLSNNPNFKIFK